MASGTAPADGKPPPRGRRAGREGRRKRIDFWANLATLIAVLLAAACGLLLLWGIWDGNPAAAPFTRVGGETSVETAVDASRFWLTSPQVVVETSATAPASVMLGAAQCAMVYDAPLLFTSQNPKRERLVDETIDGWNDPFPIIIQNYDEVTYCLEMKTADRAAVIGLSTLPGPYSLVKLPSTSPKIPTQQLLNPVVVFAAALGPGFLPDVAVGMALSAHMAKSDKPASLVVIPRYLEADPELEMQLERQHKLVEGGVVLGQTTTVPDDTVALLRQLLTARDRQGVLAQIQDNLGSVDPLIAALLALFGLAAADRVVHVLVRIEKNPGTRVPFGISAFFKKEMSKVSSVATEQLERVGKIMPSTRKPSDDHKSASAAPYWRTALGDNQAPAGEDQEVAIWLRSGTKVVGIVSDWYPSEVEKRKDDSAVLINAILRLVKATLTRAGDPAETVACNFVLVPVEDIELIAKVPRSSQ